MGVHFYETSPSWPGEQEARLRPLSSILQAGIPFVVIAEDALSIVHRVPTCLFDMQLLVPDNRVNEVAQIICANGPYTTAVDTLRKRWTGLVRPEVGRPYWGRSLWDSTRTVQLVHMSPQDCLSLDDSPPVHFLIHPQSSFHFDVEDGTRTCLNPEPPSADLAAIRFPTLAAFHDMLVDTIHDPPVDHCKLSMHLCVCMGYLITYSLSDLEGALFEGEPHLGTKHLNDFNHLLPLCWRVLDEIRDDNKLCLARQLMEPIGISRQTENFERYLIRQGMTTGQPLAPSSYPADLPPSEHPQHLAVLQSSYIARKPTFTILKQRWPRVFQFLPTF